MSDSQLKTLRDRAARYRKDMQAQSEIISRKRKISTDSRQAAAKSKSASTIKSKLRAADSADTAIAAAEKKRAAVEKHLNTTEKQIDAMITKDEKARTIAFKEIERRTAQSTRQFTTFAEVGTPVAKPVSDNAKDVFLSHASEDKDAIARPLQEALEARGVSVWFDKIQITVGKSIRQEIENGIANCRYGVVIISPSFFAKQWTQAELDGLFSKKMSSGDDVILPVWHHVSKQEVLEQSPLLAGIAALNSSLQTVDEMAEILGSVINPD